MTTPPSSSACAPTHPDLLLHPLPRAARPHPATRHRNTPPPRRRTTLLAGDHGDGANHRGALPHHYQPPRPTAPFPYTAFLSRPPPLRHRDVSPQPPTSAGQAPPSNHQIRRDPAPPPIISPSSESPPQHGSWPPAPPHATAPDGLSSTGGATVPSQACPITAALDLAVVGLGTRVGSNRRQPDRPQQRGARRCISTPWAPATGSWGSAPASRGWRWSDGLLSLPTRCSPCRAYGILDSRKSFLPAGVEGLLP